MFPVCHSCSIDLLVLATLSAVNELQINAKSFNIFMQVPGLLKIRHIGQTTLGSAAIFGLFLGAGSLIHCGKSY